MPAEPSPDLLRTRRADVGQESDHPPGNPFSIELFARIVHVGAGDGPYCLRIEATAQEKLGAAGAFGRIRWARGAKAAAQLGAGKLRPVAVDRIERGTDGRPVEAV